MSDSSWERKQRKYIEQINKSKVKVLCNCEAYDKKTHMYTYVCMYIKSTMVKVVSLEIASSIEIKSIISNFLGAGWRIWPSNYSYLSKHNGCYLDKFILIK